MSSLQRSARRRRLHRLLASTFLPVLSVLLAGPAGLAQSPLGDPMTIGVELLAEGLTSPVYLTSANDGSGRMFVVDQIGLIHVLDADGTLLAEPFLDLRDRLVELSPNFDERGLLGLAFHPEYALNGRFFVYYSAPLRAGAPVDFDHTSHLSELLVSADPGRADPTSEQILLQIDQPQANHNAGTLAFGPADGFLYLSLGDGGGADDVGTGHVEDWYPDNAGGNGQDVQENLLGSILRLDVDGSAPYAIPPDNPFAGGVGCADGCDEIFAYGFRNPYRFSFDPAGENTLLVGDSGQNLWEEVSVVVNGGNYGWNVKEGTHCFDAEDHDVSPAECPDTVGGSHPAAGDPLLDPVIEYANANNPDGGLGVVVVGGHVYRGDALPQLRGRYVFGDFSRGFFPPDGTLFAAQQRRKGLWLIQELAIQGRSDGRLGHYVRGFGQDPGGEVYVLTSDQLGPTGSTGRVYRLAGPGRR